MNKKIKYGQFTEDEFECRHRLGYSTFETKKNTSHNVVDGLLGFDRTLEG